MYEKKIKHMVRDRSGERGVKSVRGFKKKFNALKWLNKTEAIVIRIWERKSNVTFYKKFFVLIFLFS